MKNKNILGILLITIVFSSCDLLFEKKGTCETSVINFQGYQLYLCKEDVEDWLCEDNTEVFYESESCYDLGYTYKDDDHWVYSEGNNYTPGRNGAFSGSGGSGSGGSGSGYCSNGYAGPSGDPQVDSFCQAAWNAICNAGYSPTSTEVKAYCANYNYLEPQDACPYCN